MVTCICTHPKADHVFALLVPGICDLCDCAYFIEDAALTAVEAYEGGGQ